MHYLSESHIFIFLVQVFLLLGLARGLGEVFRRWNQPALTAEILVGVLLGPSIFGRFFPEFQAMIFPIELVQQNMLETVTWLGVLFLLLETGMEVELSSAWRQRKDALKIALSDIIIPMVIAFIPCYFLSSHYLVNPDQRLIFSLFMATVMTISAMPIAARALHDLKLSKTDLGSLIMSALSINDIIGWLIFTIVLGVFTQASIDIPHIIIIIAATICFTILSLTIGRTLSINTIARIKNCKMPEPGSSLTFICLLGLFCGAITQKIGIHALFGFFIAGIMVSEAKALSERTRQVISQMVYAIFVPLFFASIGLKIDFIKNFDLFLVLLISVIGIGGRFLGAWIGASFTENSTGNRFSIAVAHTPGGAMEIVIGVLALEYNLITETVFIAIVFAAVFSSIILGPWLNYSVSRRRKINILEYFSRRMIFSNLKSFNKDGVIHELCEMAAEEIETYDSKELTTVVLNREKDIRTAIENGIAIPHARLASLKKPVVVFGRSISGVEWNSPDGQLTNIIFLTFTPEKDSDVQLQIISAIAKFMSDPQMKVDLRKAEDEHALWSILHKTFSTHHIIRKSVGKS